MQHPAVFALTGGAGFATASANFPASSRSRSTAARSLADFGCCSVDEHSRKFTSSGAICPKSTHSAT
ncbi:hypothetical protein DWX41_15825 [Hungatella hathewayi]|uniref:Uncharacterized protein n=1 Tax=Hungatella hathewayi TaxID=154046 RepID=A0A3E2WNV7_9FIRM|nr:hypothetical protein DWX41_15825 [Hungatella hathewayi]